jgi:hypothetical protein
MAKVFEEAEHPRNRVGEFSAKTPTAPSEQLEAVAPDFADRAEELLAENRRLWLKLNAKHRNAIYADALTLAESSDDPATLALLARFQGAGVAAAVAGNPHTPAAVLHAMVSGDFEWLPQEALEAALRHPNCDEATLRAVL